MPGDTLRRVGVLERYHIVLTHFGLDSCVIVSAEYHAVNGSIIDVATLYPALRQIVLQHAGLCVQITKDDPVKHPPHFVRPPSVSLDSVVSFVRDSGTPLEDLLMAQFVEPFQIGGDAPLWRLIVVNAHTIVFVYHHAIGDGQSGPAFHHSLLAALNSTQPEDTPDPTVTIPETLSLTPPVEALTNTTASIGALCHALYGIFAPKSWTSGYKAWTGNNIPREPTLKMYVRCWTIPAAHATQLVKLCRQHNTTLTAFLHTLISRAMARFAPNDKGRRYKTLKIAIPVSLRRYTGAAPSALCDQVTSYNTSFPISSQSKSKKAEQKDENAFPWETSVKFGTRMHKKMRSTRGVVGLLSYLFRLNIAHEYFMDPLGEKRESTLVISNLGRFPPQEAGKEEPRWKIGRVVFAQADGVHGPAAKINVVGCPDGDLSFTFTWGEGAFDEGVAEGFITETKTSLAAVMGVEAKELEI